jgi:hypothetical protein
MKLFRKLFTIDCCECKEIKVWFWNCRCDFCDIGEGQILGAKNDTN